MLGVLLALAVAAWQGETRFRVYARDHLAVQRFQPDPLIGFTFAQDCEEVNAEGFRTPQVPPRAAADEFRILCLGDSFAAGGGPSEASLFPNVLQQVLQVRAPRRTVRVINTAVDGYNLAHMTRVLRTYADRYQPDVLMVAFYPDGGRSDVTRTVPAWRVAVRRLLFRSALCRWVTLRLYRAEGFGAWQPLVPYEDSDPMKATRAGIRAIRSLAAARGIPILATVAIRTEDDTSRRDPPIRPFASTPAELRQAVDEAAAGPGCATVWLEDSPLRREPPAQVMQDGRHLNVRGHERVAHLLADELRRRGYLSSGAPQ